MKPLSQYSHDSLRLEQPSVWKRIHHLRAGEEILCTMTRPRFFGTTVVIEGFGGVWEVSQPSLWRPVLEIRKQHQHLPFATYVSGQWGKNGTFVLPNGERIELVQRMWKSVNELHSAQKVVLVAFKRISWWKGPLQVMIEHASEVLDRHPWIIMVAYMKMLERQRQSS